MSRISVEIKGGMAYITSPYSPDFVDRIKLAGGRWDADSKQWKVVEEALPIVRGIMMDIYGETDEAPAGELVTLVVKFLENVYASTGPVIFAGRIIAAAWGRDSGARVGDDVAFVSGAPQSGGSRINWETVVKAGSVVELYNIPLPKAQAIIADPPKNCEVAIKGSVKLDKEALAAERERLMERIKEIDKLLEDVPKG